MIGLPAWEFSFGGAAILLVLELLTGTLVLAGFAAGLACVAATELCAGGAAPIRDTILFVCVAAVAIVALRAAFRQPGDAKRQAGDVNEY